MATPVIRLSEKQYINTVNTVATSVSEILQNAYKQINTLINNETVNACKETDPFDSEPDDTRALMKLDADILFSKKLANKAIDSFSSIIKKNIDIPEIATAITGFFSSKVTKIIDHNESIYQKYEKHRDCDEKPKVEKKEPSRWADICHSPSESKLPIPTCVSAPKILSTGKVIKFDKKTINFQLNSRFKTDILCTDTFDEFKDEPTLGKFVYIKESMMFAFALSLDAQGRYPKVFTFPLAFVVQSQWKGLKWINCDIPNCNRGDDCNFYHPSKIEKFGDVVLDTGRPIGPGAKYVSIDMDGDMVMRGGDTEYGFVGGIGGHKEAYYGLGHQLLTLMLLELLEIIDPSTPKPCRQVPPIKN